MSADSRCPGCRARLGESPVCRRCGCDLTLSLRAQARAERLIDEAIQAWGEDDVDRARSLTRAARALDRSELAWALERALGSRR